MGKWENNTSCTAGMESPEPFLWGLLAERPSLGAENFVGSLAESGCVHAVGVDGSSRTGNVSAVGDEIKVDIINPVTAIFSLGVRKIEV